MKKYLFLILTTSLTILLLLYFYDEKEKVLNKEYQNINTHIEYPYFNNTLIDNYINNYLSNIITNTNYEENLFIDYDYYEENEVINLSMYTYKEQGKIVNNNTINFKIDINTNKITTTTTKKKSNIYYDFYKQKLIDKTKPMIALTFDDGPNYNTSKVLDILEKYNVKATFFILGTNIKGNEDIIERMDKLGMEIGNHMYSHKLVTRLKEDQLKGEITKVDTLISDITGKYPTLIRPSYGTYNKKIKKAVDRPIIIWNVDTLDWKSHNSKKISNRLLKNTKNGNIILMHDIYSATANSLEITIPKLLEMGYQLVTVSDLFYYNDKNLTKGSVYGGIN